MITKEPDQSASQWIDTAAANFSDGKVPEARQCLEQAAQAEPTNGNLYLASGHIRLAMGDFDDALVDYTLAKELLPEVAASHSSRSLALLLLERPEEAEGAAELALTLAPSDIVALKVLARIRLNADNHDAARQLCRQILDLNPGDPDAVALLSECKFSSDQITGKGFAQQLSPVITNDKIAVAPTDSELKHLLGNLLENQGFRRVQRLGFHLQRNDYYSPLNDCDQLETNRDVWKSQEISADINWEIEEQMAVARKIGRYVEELRDIPIHPPADGSLFAWKNNFWENADAIAQYGIVRSHKPARYVEIGCGWSTLLLKKALAENAKEGSRTDVTLIEPYPNPRLFKHFPSHWTIHRSTIQRASLVIFDSLEAGDVLFYDGSHCSKVGSDVNWFFFKILPRLKPGVIIHLHDIFLPNEYPEPWIFERGQTWNEQYVLQAFLMNNRDYRILIANRFLFTQRQKELEQLYQSIQPVYGSSFWMQKGATAIASSNEKLQCADEPAVSSESAMAVGALIKEASTAYEIGDHSTARAHLNAAGNENIATVDDALGLGFLALNLGTTTIALDYFSRATKLNSADAFAHSSRALALQLLGRTDEAKVETETALTLNSTDALALKVLAQIQLNAGQHEKALALARRILSQNPQDADGRRIEREANLILNPSPAAALFGPQPTPKPAAANPASTSKLDGLLGDYSTRCNTWQKLGVEHLMQQFVVGEFHKPIESFAAPIPEPAGVDGFPVPPATLTMGYGKGDLARYIASGDVTYKMLTGILAAQNVVLGTGDAMLDWGGAAGRVVRKFVKEARQGCEVWGCDVHTPSIQWAQNHLSPTFKFFNSSAIPHLPFPDNTFKFIYGMSVMTHLVTMRDLWLLELNRVLRPGGCLILTIHNEKTWGWFREKGMPAWMPRELRDHVEMPGECLEIRGSRWEHVYTFFHSDYVRRVWGQLIEVTDIVHCADVYQTAVVMRKR